MHRNHLIALLGVLLLALGAVCSRASAVSGDGRPSASRLAGCVEMSGVHCVFPPVSPTVPATSTPVPFITGSAARSMQPVGVASLFIFPSQPFGRPATIVTPRGLPGLKAWAAGVFENAGFFVSAESIKPRRKPNTDKGPIWCLYYFYPYLKVPGAYCFGLNGSLKAQASATAPRAKNFHNS